MKQASNQTNLSKLKAEKQLKVDALLTECLIFFAFSNEQFNESKTTLQEGEKYVSLGAGGYMPKGKVQTYLDGIKEINNWFKLATKDNKTRRANILYELNNHEAFYTMDIADTLAALGSDYTAKEVQAVYDAEFAKYADA